MILIFIHDRFGLWNEWTKYCRWRGIGSVTWAPCVCCPSIQYFYTGWTEGLSSFLHRHSAAFISMFIIVEPFWFHFYLLKYSAFGDWMNYTHSCAHYSPGFQTVFLTCVEYNHFCVISTPVEPYSSNNDMNSYQLHVTCARQGNKQYLCSYLI